MLSICYPRVGKVSSLQSCIFYAEVQAICSIPIALETKADSLVWHFEPKGDYLVKSGYKIAREKVSNMLSQIPVTSFQPSKKMWKLIWALKMPPKLKHFWWLVCKNVLATKDNLYCRKCAGTRLCPICQKYPEIVEHLLFGYEWVRAVWFGSDLKFNIDGGPNLSILKWSSDLLNRLSHPKSGRVLSVSLFGSGGSSGRTETILFSIILWWSPYRLWLELERQNWSLIERLAGMKDNLRMGKNCCRGV